MNTATRYLRGRVTVPAGTVWTHLIGIDDLDFKAEGRQ